MIKTLYEIFDSNINMAVSSSYKRNVKNCIARDPYYPDTTYQFEFSVFDEESDEEVTFAFLTLKFQEYADIEDAYEYSDYRGGDEYSSVECACRFLKENEDYYSEILAENGCITICEMHNLYVSPRFRGRGISEAIKAMLSALIMELGYGSAVVVTYINPFKDQTDIPDKSRLCAEDFGGYVNDDKEIDPELYSIMGKSLKHCGFIDMGERYYLTTLDYLLTLTMEEVTEEFDAYPSVVPYYEESV